MNKLKKHPIIKKLLSLKLPTKDYAVVGSGPMFAYGIKSQINDIDIVARGKAWEMVRKLGNPIKSPLGNTIIQIFDGKVEAGITWLPGECDIDELIDTADVIEGIRFVSLENVLKWKKKMARPKDLKHIKMIEEYLSNKKKTTL